MAWRSMVPDSKGNNEWAQSQYTFIYVPHSLYSLRSYNWWKWKMSRGGDGALNIYIVKPHHSNEANNSKISSYAIEMKSHDIISARRHYKNQVLILLIKLLAFASASSLLAPTCKAENQLAYINKGSNEQPKPLMRAWMCHGKTHKEMVDKLAAVSFLHKFL